MARRHIRRTLRKKFEPTLHLQVFFFHRTAACKVTDVVGMLHGVLHTLLFNILEENCIKRSARMCFFQFPKVDTTARLEDFRFFYRIYRSGLQEAFHLFLFIIITPSIRRGAQLYLVARQRENVHFR